jgi:hypothetical protein
MNAHNNQPKDSAGGRGDIREEEQSEKNAWEDSILSFWPSICVTKKLKEQISSWLQQAAI